MPSSTPIKEVAGVVGSERRAAKRFPANLAVLLVWEGKLVQASVDDIAMSGMRLASELDLDVGTTLRARFAPKGDTETYKLSGRIVWSHPSDEIAGIYVAGYQFGALPAPTVEKLAQLIRQVGGESGADDLPIISDEAIVSVPATGAGTGQLPDIDLQPAQRQRTPAPAAAPQPAPAVEPGKADRYTAALELANAVAEDAHLRERHRSEAATVAKTARNARRSGDLATAATAFRRAIQLAPDVPEYYEDLADVTYLSGDTHESARLLDRALRLRAQKR